MKTLSFLSLVTVSINPMFLKNTLMFVCNDLDVFKKHKVD